MNLFVLDSNPIVAARFHNDRHVPKMILESAQLLSMAHVYLDGESLAKTRVPMVLRPTHINHPVSVWTRTTNRNYQWVHQLLRALSDEHVLRFNGRNMLDQNGAIEQLKLLPLNIPFDLQTPFPHSVPPQYRRSDPVESARLYYFGEKKHIAAWHSPRAKPDWWERLERKEGART